MSKTEIINAKIFDGRQVSDLKSVVIDDGLISFDNKDAVQFDATGCTLLPGLIDAHAHLYENTKYLKMAAKNGVTTLCDMGIRDPKAVDPRRNIPRHASVFSSMGLMAAPGSKVTEMMGYPESMITTSAQDAVSKIDALVKKGADYIKLILEEPGRNDGVEFPPDIAAAIISEAHKNHKLVMAHAVTIKTYKTGADIGVDVLMHVPFEAPLPQELVEELTQKGVCVAPTMVMMKAILDRYKTMNPNIPFQLETCLKSVEMMHKAGVTILAGTDSTMDDPLTPASVPYGTGLHDELGLLVKAGFTPLEALRSATSEVAKHYGFADRGSIEAGRRADLFLVKGDPTENIEDIRNIKAVIINGMFVEI